MASGEDSYRRLQQLPGDLADAVTAFDRERARIVSDYGAGASVAPAIRAFRKTLGDLDREYAAVSEKGQGWATLQARWARREASTKTEYTNYQICLAAHAVLLPQLSEAQLLDRFSQAVEDERVSDSLALRELTLIRIAKPSAALIELQRRAFVLAAPSYVRTTESLVETAASSVKDYQAQRAACDALLAEVESQA